MLNLHRNDTWDVVVVELQTLFPSMDLWTFLVWILKSKQWIMYHKELLFWPTLSRSFWAFLPERFLYLESPFGLTFFKSEAYIRVRPCSRLYLSLSFLALSPNESVGRSTIPPSFGSCSRHERSSDSTCCSSSCSFLALVILNVNVSIHFKDILIFLLTVSELIFCY